MALLDTLKSGLTSVVGAVAPVTTTLAKTASNLLSSARSAASMSPTPTTTSPTTTKTTLGPYVGEPASSAVKQIGQTPITNVSSGQTTKSNSGYVAPTKPPAAIATAPVAPKTTAPASTTASNPNFNFGPVTYNPQTQGYINSLNSTRQNSANQNNANQSNVVNSTANSAPMQSGVRINTELPTQNTELSDLEKAIMGTYSQSEGERSAQDALTRLAQQQADLSGAYRSGTNKIGEQPIILDLLRGQQQALQKQYEGQVGALADQAKPLEVQLANLVANREQQNKALNTQYGFAQNRIAQEQAAKKEASAASKPFEMGGNLIALNPATGKYEVVYQGPSAGSEGFTLGEGQMRFDANGNLIASGGQKQSSVTDKITMVDGKPYTYQNGVLTPVQTAGVTPANQQKVGTINTLLDAVDSVMNDPGLKSRVGWQGALPAIPGTEGANFDNKLDFLKAQFERMGVDLLRGLGAMSEGERAAMTKSMSAISRTQSEAEFKNELNRIKEVFTKQRDILQSQPDYSSGSSVTISPQQLQQSGLSQNDYQSMRNAGMSDQEIAKEFNIPFTNDLGKSLNGQIGSLSAKYESNGNPGAIGYDRTGGYSYGTYQLAHNNALNFVQQSPYAQAFANIPFNSAQFQQRWKQVASQDPQGFAQAQHDYIAKTHLEPIVRRLQSEGFDVSHMSPAVHDVLWSTAVQHGPGTKIIEQALNTAKDEQDFIRKVYALRWNNGAGFASSTPQVRQSVYNRFFGQNGELANALAMSQAMSQNA